MFRRDFLLRELKRVMDGIARVMNKSNAGEKVVALQELGALYDEILGEHRTLLDHTDSQTMAKLLGAPERTASVARLLAAEASVIEYEDATTALLKRAKATELMLEAVAEGFDDEGVIEEWAVPHSLLSTRAQGLR